MTQRADSAITPSAPPFTLGGTVSALDPQPAAASSINLEYGKRLMLYFMQEGCPYCKQLVTVNFRDPRIAEKMRRNFMSVAINIWGDREITAADGRKVPEKRFAAALKVQFTPTLVFFDEKGGRLNG